MTPKNLVCSSFSETGFHGFGVRGGQATTDASICGTTDQCLVDDGVDSRVLDAKLRQRVDRKDVVVVLLAVDQIVCIFAISQASLDADTQNPKSATR